jgi:hypothetical protein
LAKQIKESDSLTEELGPIITKMWESDFAQKLWKRKNEFLIYPWAN